MALKISAILDWFYIGHFFNLQSVCIMSKSKISAPVGFFNAKRKPENQTQDNNRRMYNEHLKAWYTSDDGGLSWVQEMQETQEMPTICQSLGFSLELIPSGKFVTVEFITKAGELRKYNGRTGVKKYLKHSTIGNAEKGEYFILWVRRGGIKFNTVAMVHKRKIVKLSAGGVVLWQNKSSHYAKAV